MNKEALLRKAESNEGMTVSEIKAYQKIVKPVQHTYGKYGTLAKQYLEKHNIAKYWALAGDLPEYLHGIDRQAERLWEVIYEKLSKDERYKHTTDFMENVRRENEIKRLIEEEILNELVYV